MLGYAADHQQMTALNAAAGDLQDIRIRTGSEICSSCLHANTINLTVEHSSQLCEVYIQQEPGVPAYELTGPPIKFYK
jgi:hypothetical protein